MIVELVWAARDVESIMKESTNEDTSDTKNYCWCGDDLGGTTMVQCDNDACRNGEWFHLMCLQLEEDDVSHEEWFCTPQCEQEKKGRLHQMGNQLVSNYLNLTLV